MLDSNDLSLILLRTAVSRDSAVRNVLDMVITQEAGENGKSALASVDHRVIQILDLAIKHHRATGYPLTPDVAGAFSAVVQGLQPLDDVSAPVWAVSQLRNARVENDIATLLVKSLELLKIGDPVLGKGASAAITHLMENIPASVASESTQSEQADFAALKEDYDKRARMGSDPIGIPSGLASMDALTDGQFPGELFVFAAYAGQGKSFALQNIAYHRKMLGYNGIFWSTEQHPQQIAKRLVTRHTMDPRFARPGGLLYDHIKFARLSPEDADVYKSAVDDFVNNPDYGYLSIRPAPAGSSMVSLMRRTEELARSRPIDYVVVDYLSQLRPSRGWGSERESLTHLFIESKAMALSFNQNKGVPLLTAAQTNPASFEKACERGYYTIRSVAESAEAERSADFLAYLLQTPDQRAVHELKYGVLKYRDGESGTSSILREDFAHCALLNQDIPDHDNSFWSTNIS